MKDNERKVYSSIGSTRLLDIRVILDNNIVYEGMVEDAPEEIRKLKYSDVDMNSDKFTFYVYGNLN